MVFYLAAFFHGASLETSPHIEVCWRTLQACQIR